MTKQQYEQADFLFRRRLHYQGDACDKVPCTASGLASVPAPFEVPMCPIALMECGYSWNTDIAHRSLSALGTNNQGKSGFRYCPCEEGGLTLEAREYCQNFYGCERAKGEQYNSTDSLWSPITTSPPGEVSSEFLNEESAPERRTSWRADLDTSLLDHPPSSPSDIATTGVLWTHVASFQMEWGEYSDKWHKHPSDPDLDRWPFTDAANNYTDGSVRVSQWRRNRTVDVNKDLYQRCWPPLPCKGCPQHELWWYYVDPIDQHVLAITTQATFDATPYVAPEALAVLSGSSQELVVASEPRALAAARGARWLAVELDSALEPSSVLRVDGGNLVRAPLHRAHALSSSSQQASPAGSSDHRLVGISTKNQIALIGGTAPDGTANESLWQRRLDGSDWRSLDLFGDPLEGQVTAATYRVGDESLYAVSERGKHKKALRTLWRIELTGRVTALKTWHALGAMRVVTLTTSDREELLLTMSGPPAGAHAIVVLRVDRDGNVLPQAFRVRPGRIGEPHLDQSGISAAVESRGKIEPARIRRSELITPGSWSSLQ